MTMQGNATTHVRDGFRFDEARLQVWLQEQVDGFEGPLTVRQFQGGQSNPTFELITPKRSYVLRRQPSGPLLKGAHAVDREARVMSALSQVGFPVPHIHALCSDVDVIGSMFYVMAKVQGRIFRDASFPEVPKAQRAPYMDAMNATLARLHTIGIEQVGLQDFGRPQNYLARQIQRWSKQYLEDTDAGRNAHMDELIQWLQESLPAEEGGSSIIHGDFRIDNMVFHPHEPEVIAVLDWELSTLGDPIADFTYHLMMYYVPPRMWGGLAGVNIAEQGLMDEDTYIRRYCKRTNRTALDNVNFYLVFNLFRFAAILHGIKGRVIRGTAAASDAAQASSNLEFLAARAMELAHDAAR